MVKKVEIHCLKRHGKLQKNKKENWSVNEREEKQGRKTRFQSALTGGRAGDRWRASGGRDVIRKYFVNLRICARDLSRWDEGGAAAARGGLVKCLYHWPYHVAPPNPRRPPSEWSYFAENHQLGKSIKIFIAIFFPLRRDLTIYPFVIFLWVSRGRI